MGGEELSEERIIQLERESLERELKMLMEVELPRVVQHVHSLAESTVQFLSNVPETEGAGANSFDQLKIEIPSDEVGRSMGGSVILIGTRIKHLGFKANKGLPITLNMTHPTILGQLMNSKNALNATIHELDIWRTEANLGGSQHTRVLKRLDIVCGSLRKAKDWFYSPWSCFPNNSTSQYFDPPVPQELAVSMAVSGDEFVLKLDGLAAPTGKSKVSSDEPALSYVKNPALGFTHMYQNKLVEVVDHLEWRGQITGMKDAIHNIKVAIDIVTTLRESIHLHSAGCT